MSATEINAFIALATFLVISITAIAAVIQLRHLRRANEPEGLISVLSRVEDLGFQSWVDDTRQMVTERMSGPEFRRSILEGTFERVNNPWLMLANSYEWLGALVWCGLIPEDPVMDIYAGRIIAGWKSTEPIIAVIRGDPGNKAVLENFEYLHILAEQYSVRHPSIYPEQMPHAEVHDAWAQADGVAVAT